MTQEKQTKLPIELKLFTTHRLGEEVLSPEQEIKMKAEQCAFMAEGLFLAIEKICKDAAFADPSIDNPLPKNLVLGLAHMAEIGVALTTVSSQYIDQMELSSRRSKTVGA